MNLSKGHMYFNGNIDRGAEAEFEADTTEEAIIQAEQTLGIDREKMKIKVVCEEKKGLFGMRGAKGAKIKVLFAK
jgi:predicted RNA-binding protein Jag